MKFFSKHVIVLLMIFMSLTSLQAQDQMQLAITYYNQKEYVKAAPLFRKLYNERRAKYYFDYYLRCLLAQKKYDKAERVVKKELRHHSDQKSFIVDLAHIYELEGRQSEAQKLYKDLLNHIPRDRGQIIQIGNSLLNYRQYELAEQFYQKAHRLTGQNFFNELYVVYTLSQNKEKLVDLFLDWLEAQPQSLFMVEARIRPNLQREINNNFSALLEQHTLARIKKTRSTAFYKLLIWLYTEKRQLSKALEVAEYFDRRLHGFGKEVFSVGQIAYDYDSLAIARQAFEYLVKKGIEYPFYHSAQEQLLRVYYKQIQAGQILNPQQIKHIEQQYIAIIKSRALSSQTIELVIQLAHLEAFYLHSPYKAIRFIDQALAYPRLTPQKKASLYLEKAKVRLVQDKPWQALILLNKIAYDFSNTEEALEAQLLAGKTFMYQGQTEVAKIYFDKIKGYVSSPVANDAIIKAFFIAQAHDDSLKMHLLQVYARAEYLNITGRLDSAAYMYDSVASQASFLADRALLDEGKMFLTHWQYDKALSAFERLINNFTASVYADQALFLAATIYEHQGQTGKARQYYRKIIFDHRDSPLAWAAREKFRNSSTQN